MSGINMYVFNHIEHFTGEDWTDLLLELLCWEQLQYTKKFGAIAPVHVTPLNFKLRPYG
jgi:hypothetical protein